MRLAIYLIIATVIATALHASAETYPMRKTLICDTQEEIFTRLAGEFEEEPVWTGKSPLQSTEVVLTVNQSTGAWTLVEFKDDWACVLAVGENSRSKQLKNTNMIQYKRLMM